MTLPSYVRLPATFQAPERVQKVKYSGILYQCFVCNCIGHVVKDCPVRDEQNLQKRFSSNTNDEGWIEGRRKHDRKSSVRTANGIGITSSKRSHATDDDSQLNKTNLQIIPFNNSDVQLHREEDYNIVIDRDIVKTMTDKPLKGGNDHEHITTFESSALQGESHMELVVVEKNEESKTVISLEDGHMDGLQYSGRLTRAKTKALASHAKNAQGFMLGKSVVRSYTMVTNGGMMVEGKGTISSSMKKDTYAEVVARKSWKGFKIARKINKSKKVTMEEKKMKGKQLLLAYG